MPIRLLSALLLAPIALAACAQMAANRYSGVGATAPVTPPVSFIEADLDGDARITPREFYLWLREPGEPRGFEAFDTNRDGVLTLDEWQTMLSRPSASPSGAFAGASRPVPSPAPNPAAGASRPR